MRFMNALKVQGNLAQGNALGQMAPPSISPCKGRIKAAFTLPFQGIIVFGCPQPSPLGWAKY